MLDFSRLLFLCCVLSIHLGRVNAVCYYPNGDVARDDQACDNTKSISVCCGQGYACLSNGLCQKTVFTEDKEGDKYGRGSCTDRKWGVGCPNYCVNAKIDIVNGGSGMGICPSVNKFFCMNSEKASVDCTSGRGVYTLGIGSALTTIGFPGPSSSSTISTLKTSTRTTTSSTTTSRASSSISTTRTTSATASNPTNPTSIPFPSFTTPFPISTASTTSPPTPPTSNSPNTNSVAIGAGVGVGAGIVLLGIIAALLLYIRRRRKAQEDPRGSLRYSHPPSYHGGLSKDQRHLSLQKDRELPIPIGTNNDGRTYELL